MSGHVVTESDSRTMVQVCPDSLLQKEKRRTGKSQPAKGHGGVLRLNNVPLPVRPPCRQEIMADSS